MARSLNPFADSFATARAKLLESAATAQCLCTSLIEPGLGINGETLAMDVIRAGARDPSRTLLVTSACHGIEGYAGSAVQIGLLRDETLLRHLEKCGVSLLLIHGLNPHGFSFSHRSTAENVDLNRNFVDFCKPPPCNSGYRDFHHLLVPRTWPPSQEAERALSAMIAEQGMRAFQETVTRGQHEYPDGLFFGGVAPTWSHLALRKVLRREGPMVSEAVWIDIHTGLGPCGAAERIFTGSSEHAKALALRWWGSITNTSDGSSSSTLLSGTLSNLMVEEFSDRLLTSIALEFGTVPPMEVLNALRLDAWSKRSATPAAKVQVAANAMRECFYVETNSWKESVLDQSVMVIEAAIEGLARKENGYFEQTAIHDPKRHFSTFNL